MFCPSCGTKNNYYHRYCFHCGTQLIEDVKKGEQELDSTVEGDLNGIVPPISHNQGDDLGSSYHEFIHTNPEDDYDISSQIPLRRYQKELQKHSGVHTLMTFCIFLVLSACIVFVGYIGYDKLIRNHDPATNPSKNYTIDFLHEVEEDITDNQSSRRITIHSKKGERVKILNMIKPIINEKAEFVIKDTELFALQDTDGSEMFDISLDIELFADGYPDRKARINFKIPVPYSPLSLITPKGGEAFVEGQTYNLIIDVIPGSTVLVNDSSYSNQVDGNGHLSIKLDVPDLPDNRYIIKVSTRGYADMVKEIRLKRVEMDFPLAIDQQIPIKTAEDWVKITGTTHPMAELTTNLKLQEEPVIDPDTGVFELYVQVSHRGYTPLVITASLETFDNSIINLVIDKNISESEYTSIAWAPEYEILKAHPDIQNGQIFLFEGNIKNIISSGDKNTFIVDTATEGSAEQLIYVEHWGTFSFTQGQRVRLFGNRWRNHDGIPRILARHIYRG